MSAVAAALITTAVVFMVGLFVMCLMKKMGAAPGVSLKEAPARGHTAKSVSAAGVADLLDGLRDGDALCIVLHMKSCGYCKKLLGEVIGPMSDRGELPVPTYTLEVDQAVAEAAKSIPALQAFMKQASGVPATMVVRSRGGKLGFDALVGYMPSDKFVQAVDAAGGDTHAV